MPICQKRICYPRKTKTSFNFLCRMCSVRISSKLMTNRSPSLISESQKSIGNLKNLKHGLLLVLSKLKKVYQEKPAHSAQVNVSHNWEEYWSYWYRVGCRELCHLILYKQKLTFQVLVNTLTKLSLIVFLLFKEISYFWLIVLNLLLHQNAF